MGGYNSSFSSPQVEQALSAALLQEKSSYNITQDKKKNYVSLTEAIAAVSDEKYKVNGLVMTFYTGTEWISKRYNGADSSGFATEDNWIDAGGTSGGTQYLDLSMFASESGTLSEEDYQKIVNAYNNKTNIGFVNIQNGDLILYGSLSISLYFQESYIINIYRTHGGNAGQITLASGYAIVNVESHSFESNIKTLTDSMLSLETSGSGTKALADNGQYVEFASLIKTQDGGSGTVTKELQPNTFYKFGDCSSLTITLAAKKLDIFNEYMFEFKCGESPTTLSLPESIEWDRGNVLSTKALNKYIISIIENIATYKEVVWYKKVESIQVNNTSDTYYVRINGVDINKVDSFLYRIGDNIILFTCSTGRVSITLRYKDGTTANKSANNNMQSVITIEKEINQVIINY